MCVQVHLMVNYDGTGYNWQHYITMKTAQDQAKTKRGGKRYAIQCSKYKRGAYIVRKLMVESSAPTVSCLINNTAALGYTTTKINHLPNYVTELFSELLRTVEDQGNLVQKLMNDPHSPLCSSFCHPDKEEAVGTFRSRFSCN